MASFIISDAAYEVVGKTVTVNYAVDVILSDVKLTNGDNNFIEPISFSQTCALFDISDWVNGSYANCILRGWYNDNIVDIITNTSALSLDEGSSTTFTVKLDKAPDDDVTIRIYTDNTTDLTVNPSSLTFTPSNYSTEQTVTVTGNHNTDDEDKTAKITLSNIDMESKSIDVIVKNTDIHYGNI